MVEQPIDQNDDAVFKPKTRQAKNGCRSDCLGCLLALIVVAFLILVVPLLIRQVSFSGKLRAWETSGIDSYTMTIAIVAAPGDLSKFRLVVRNGDLVAVDGLFEPLELDRFREYTIEGLFERAKNCYLLCQVEYDAQYGYPKKFTGGFIESSETIILDFQPLEE